MSNTIKILIAEHDPIDLELIRHELKKAGLTYISEAAHNQKDYSDTLKNFLPDIILSDYTFPSFNGTDAFKLRQLIAPRTPFIFVSGTIGEEKAVELIKNGVTDYVLKDKLFTLPIKVKRALQESKEKREKDTTSTNLQSALNDLKKIMDSSVDIICTVDEEGRFAKVSAASANVWGYRPNELSGKPFIEFVHPEDREISAKAATSVMAGLEITNFENRYVRKDCSLVPITWSARWDNNDNMMYCVARNATEKQEVEKAIETERQRYVDLFKQAPISIGVLKGKDHVVEMGNAQYLQLIGRQNIIGKSIKELLPEVVDQGFIEILDNVYKTGKPFLSNEMLVQLNRSGNGKLDDVYLNIFYQAYRNNKGKIEGVFFFTADVTESVLLRKKIEESSKQYRQIVETAQEGIWMIDENNVTTLVNKKIADILEYPVEEMMGKQVYCFMDDEGKEIASRAIASGKSGKNARQDFKYISKSGRDVWTNISANPVFDSNGVYKGALGMVTDITERQQVDVESKRLANRLLMATSSAGMGIWEWDIEKNHLQWDEGMYRLYKINSAQFESLYEGWLARLHPDDKGRVNEDIQMAIAGKKEYNTEFRIAWDDSSVHYIKATGMIESNDAGNATRMIGVNWDITEQKEREERFKLFESVITNMTESVLVTEAEPFDAPDPKIVYVNQAFTKMTGYTAEEIIGKSPRILQGPKSDRKELQLLSNSIRKWKPYETTIINYKKDGEEFWINFSLSPIADATGWFTHWISLERDVTQRKNEELQKTLMADINALFNKPATLNETIRLVLERLVAFGNVSMAEAWLIDTNHKNINLFASFPDTENSRAFYSETASMMSFLKGEGLAGMVWENKNTIFWKNVLEEKAFLRGEAAKKTGLQSAYGIPIIYHGEVIGVFILGMQKSQQITAQFPGLFENLGLLAGASIKRKQLEQELNQLFRFSPGIICIAGLDGYFKKINPSASILLEYTEEELLTVPFEDFTHPDDKGKSNAELKSLGNGIITNYFENRFITKSGKTKWLAWTSVPSPDEPLVFAVAKDVTDKKELENLLDKANTLARIGSWEVDLVNETVYFSDITKEIHELEPDFIPDLQSGINFYKEGENRDAISRVIQNAIEKSIPWDVELQIITAKGNEKWIRSIGEPEYANGKCIKLNGSFQDINEHKLSEIRLKELNENLLKQAKDLSLSNAELEQFAFVTSHDLQEPLRMITSFLTLLDKKYGNVLDDKGKQYIAFAVDGAKRMRQIILDLLEFSKVGRTEDGKENIDLNALLHEIHILFRKRITEKKAVFIIDELPQVHAHKAAIHQVFQNLISNALKYTRENIPPTIHISATELKDHWQFAVSDNGIGIDKEYFDKIFIIFQRLHNKDKFSGTGMGLSITKKIIEIEGGKIWVESEEGKGATFYFTLPRVIS